MISQIWGKLGIGVLAILVTGCIAAPQDQNQYADRVRVTDSAFDATVGYEGPVVRAGTLAWGNVYGQALLRSLRDKQTGQMAHQLYVDLAYDGRRFRWFETASLIGGQRFDLLQIDHERLNCSKDREPRPCRYAETVGLNLSLPFLLAHEHSGFSVRLNAREGSMIVFEIPPHYIQGQLKVIGY
ncbi:MAG: hypothetical protein ACE363_16420 [Alphaproteobacteria bacterium]